MDPGLDFASLLGIAEHVSKGKAGKEVQLMKTKFAGPKKEKREKGKLNDNVRKFLEKKDEEERRMKKEKKEQLKNLQELRTDSAKNKIAKHLKVTKSANKAVLSDAINKKDTAVTMTGRKQCDEDDYGFESGVSNKLYEKLMGKYESCPDDPMDKFSKSKPKSHVDISSAKERVKMALRQETEDVQIRTRKRKHGGSSIGADESGISYKRDKEEKLEEKGKEEKGKDGKLKKKDKLEAINRRKEKYKNAPKPMDFQALLEMANTVKDKPVTIPKLKKEIKKEAEIGDRPMTKKQKEEWIKENERMLRREGKLPPKESSAASYSNNNKETSKDDRTKSENRQKSEEKTSVKPPVKIRKPEPGPELHVAVRKSLPPPRRESPAEQRRPENGRSFDSKKNDEKTKMQEEYKRLQEKCKEMEDRMRLQEEHKKLQEKVREMEEKLAKSSSSSKSDSRSSSSKPEKRHGDRKQDVHEVTAREFPGEKRKKDKEKPRRNRIESDSEYDSEMDDFIDDTEDKIDISKEIRSIFGYDRNRFRDEPDFDDRSMENNRYSSIMQEEVRSARIGRMEDKEDMRREELEKKMRLKKLKGR